ncbi:MAG TPA: efflux RND transporter periplasmic adaptor subunit [Verrucomicrobiota bacterium]|nr:efflux RND transporter periplasmic adaptor subunit [Verrucomicrobiota bacterium]
MRCAVLCRVSALVLAGLLLCSCGKPATGSKARRNGEEPARPVRLAAVEMRPMERSIKATGTLAAYEESTLSAKVPGRLQQLMVDIGSVVRAGDVLAQIEPRDYELRLQQAGAALAQARVALGLPLDGDDDEIALDEVSSVKQAKAVLDEASKNQDRVARLLKSGIASDAEFDTVEATHTVAAAKYATALEEARMRMATLSQRRAEYEIARKQLADASVRAPFDGAVQSRPASVGEYVATGAPIVTVVKTNPLRLRLVVPERESMLVRAGQTVRLYAEGDAAAYPGTITRLSPALVEEDRMLRVEADVPNPGSLRPGMYASAVIVVDDRQEALTVPTNAVVTFAGIEKVVLVQDDKALEKDITSGRQRADRVEVLSGLTLGQTVVLNPAGLRTGQRVTVASTLSETPSAPAGGGQSTATGPVGGAGAAAARSELGAANRQSNAETR